ncbi:unnamed protein product [marine sediment metagenome]|uniref:Uncharacterized protein n=1 Tax=marine sediment metagenome TaxID=412755 RepID=X0UTX6_9ZZZZ
MKANKLSLITGVGKIGIGVVETRKRLMSDATAYCNYLSSVRLYKRYKERYPKITPPIRPFTIKELHKRQVETNKIRRRLGLGTLDIKHFIRQKKAELKSLDAMREQEIAGEI